MKREEKEKKNCNRRLIQQRVGFIMEIIWQHTSYEITRAISLQTIRLGPKFRESPEAFTAQEPHTPLVIKPG